MKKKKSRNERRASISVENKKVSVEKLARKKSREEGRRGRNENSWRPISGIQNTRNLFSTKNIDSKWTCKLLLYILFPVELESFILIERIIEL